jgi:predicted ABC-type ATPase
MIKSPKFIEFDEVRPDLIPEARAIINDVLGNSQKSSNPGLIHMCGIPGSGKTTHARQWLEKNSSFSLVQFDGVMEKLNGYQADRTNLGPVEAFKNWELPARAIGYHLFQSLIENRHNVFFDHSAASFAHVELIRRVKELGYFVEMRYIQCSANEVIERVRIREKIIQRHTPEHLIFERFELLNELLPTYRDMVDRFELVYPAPETRACAAE